MNELEELKLEVQRLYNIVVDAQEDRCISYGELAYIENLDEKKLNDMYEECYEELKRIKDVVCYELGYEKEVE